MQDQARVVIIGGGIVGCSTAYHLARLGWRDIVVLDQGPLFHNLGSSSHAPGLMFQHNNSKTVCTLARWSVETYLGAERLAPAGSGRSVWQVGSLEIAHSPQRWEELKRKLGNSRAWGLEAQLIGPGEVKRLVPIMYTDDLYGAFYVPSDCDVKGEVVCETLAAHAQKDGAATFYANTPVTGVEVKGGRAVAVQTPHGRLQAELIVCAAGLWGPVIGRMAGVHVPLTPCQHLYVKTRPLPELAGETEWVRHPVVRDQDQDMYYRQYANAYGFGSYRHDPLLVPADELPHNDHPAIFPFTAQHFEESWEDAAHRIPALAKAELDLQFNGLFSFTPDGNSILGETPDVRGFWVAEAVWVTHAGGVGRALAEWLVAGEPSIDLREVDVNRFQLHMPSAAFVRARGERQYIEVYDVIHQLQPPATARELRLAPYHARLQALGAELFESAGWEKAQWYSANEDLLGEFKPAPRRAGWAARFWSPTIGAEHQAARERVGLFDLTAFTKIEVTGPGALGFLQRLTANQMDRPVGSITYTSLLTPRGGIRADLTVTRLGDERFWVLTGGGSGLLDLAWLRFHAPGDGSVHIQNVTSAYAALGLWGPRAREVAQPICENDLSNTAFPYMTAQQIYLEYLPVTALRISYAGELGWEFYTPTEYGLRLWDTLWAAGQPHGLAAVGGGAFDSLRLEKGYRLWGSDIHTEYNPLEAGLGFAVRLKKGDFIGREALAQIKAHGLTRKLCAMTFDDPSVAIMGKEPIFAPGGEQALGYVTSANYGYSVGQSIAYGYLPLEHAAPGTPVEIYYYGQRHPARVRPEPLYDPENVKLKC